MVWSNATVRVQLVRRPLDQVQNPQHHNHSVLRDQPEPVLGDVLLHTRQLILAIPL